MVCPVVSTLAELFAKFKELDYVVRLINDVLTL